MPEGEQPLIEELLDYFVYAPIGIASQLIEELPNLVEAGRERLESRLRAASVAGRFTVAAARLRSAARPEPTAEETEDVIAAAVAHLAAPDASTLAIPGYDALAAAQVVARLDGLTRDERAAVRAYEEATRHRRTILSRLAQLDAEDGA
jgi:hypothetical protein